MATGASTGGRGGAPADAQLSDRESRFECIRSTACWANSGTTGRAPIIHSIVLASLVLLLALITAFTAGGQPAEFQQPPWYPFVLALVGPLGVIVGGWFGRPAQI
jgi:uncharacterized membrane protein